MAGTLNIEGATNTMTSMSYLRSALLIAAAGLAGQMWTEFARDNIVDVGMQGGDALYSLVLAFVALAVVPRRYGRPFALGLTASGVLTAAQEFNVI